MSDHVSSDKELLRLLNFDPQAAAENLTGMSYVEEDQLTMAFGLLLHSDWRDAKQTALLARDDTAFITETGRYLRIAGEEGFEVLLAEPFAVERGDETFYILWHPDGILLQFDTYGDSVNSGSFCYNVRPKDADNVRWDVLSTHGPIKGSDVRYGYHDCREALRLHLSLLRDHFDLITPWGMAPHRARMPLNYQEWNLLSEPEQQAAADARLARLPKVIRQAMKIDLVAA